MATKKISHRHQITLLLALLLCLAAGLLAVACDDRRKPALETTERINLDELVVLPEPKAELSYESLKMAVAAIMSPQGTVQSYRPLQAHMEKKLGKPVQLVQRRTYQEVNELLAANLVDVAFVCTGPFIEARREGTMELLVVPQVGGKVTYQGIFIVRADSGITTIGALRGKIFAFTDPMSNTGFLYPSSVIQAWGESPENFFGRIIFTYSHDHSIAAVLDGVVDGASVDRIVFDHALRRNPELQDRFHILLQSREYGIPPVVTPRRTTPEQRQRLQDFFLNMHHDPEGTEILKDLGIDRFVLGDPARYR